MSETVVVTGKIQRLTTNEADTIEFCNKYIADHNLQEDAKDYDDVIEYIHEVEAEKFMYLNKCLYKVLEQTRHDDDDYCHIQDLGDGIFSFYTKYYNGGTCLHEMLA